MVLVPQVLAWGYNPPPPLYPWLQALSFSVFGVNLFSLVLLKNLILLSTYLSVYLCAREVLKNEKSALVGVLSLFLIPTFVWEALRSQAHSVLVTLAAGLTLLFTVRLLRSPSLGNYCALGVLAGLGILSYYNFAVFLTAIVLAGLSSRLGRDRLLDWKAALSLLIFALLTLPHALWILQHLSYATDLVTKLVPGNSAGFVMIAADGLWNLATAILSFLGLLILCYCWLFRRTRDQYRASQRDQVSSLLGRTITLALLLCALAVIAVGGTHFKDRWLEPLLFFTPIYLLLVIRPDLSSSVFRRFICVVSLSALLALTVLHVRIPLAGLTDQVFSLNYPAPKMADELRTAGFQQGTIVVSGQALGGNLKLQFPDSTVLVPRVVEEAPSISHPIFLVWEPSQGEPDIPEFLAAFVSRKFGTDAAEITPHFVTVPYLYAKSKQVTLAYVELPPPE
jgi:4-amino-4-deoxy-L-arabinose transferase-like glycosyltransferase